MRMRKREREREREKRNRGQLCINLGLPTVIAFDFRFVSSGSAAILFSAAFH